MAEIPIVSFDDIDPLLSWDLIGRAIENGHKCAQGDISDSFCTRGDDTLLTRSAWIDGLGVMVKAATVMPNSRPSVNGGVMLFNDERGSLDAIIDFHLVTKWKTVGDSLLAAKYLAKSNSERLVILGAGTVAANLVDAYRSLFPNLQISLWNRTPDKAETLADKKQCDVVYDLADAVSAADIVSCATMSTTPVLQGKWLSDGCHVDLIGAYRADMREADDDVILAGELFVDSRETTIEHIGELRDPIQRGIITVQDIHADFYDLGTSKFKRSSEEQITVFKNGGGAHMDLMVANAIFSIWKQQSA